MAKGPDPTAPHRTPFTASATLHLGYSVLATLATHSYLWVFASVVPSAWNTLPEIFLLLILSFKSLFQYHIVGEAVPDHSPLTLSSPFTLLYWVSPALILPTVPHFC